MCLTAGINVSPSADIAVLRVEPTRNYNKSVGILDVCFTGNSEACLI